jgi:hypothetical protein
MSTPERIYRRSVRAFSVIMVAIGIALVATTLANGGGPLAIGFILGIAFVAVGAGRLWIATRMGP